MGYYDTSYPPSLWTAPPPPPDPTFTGMNPTTAVEGDPAFLLTCTGTNFTNLSKIKVDTVEYPTTFVNATTVTGNFDPATEGMYVVSIKTGEHETSNRAFTVTAAPLADPTDGGNPPDEYTAIPVKETDK